MKTFIQKNNDLIVGDWSPAESVLENYRFVWQNIEAPIIHADKYAIGKNETEAYMNAFKALNMPAHKLLNEYRLIEIYKKDVQSNTYKVIKHGSNIRFELNHYYVESNKVPVGKKPWYKRIASLFKS